MSKQMSLSDTELIEKLSSHKSLEQDAAFRFLYSKNYKSIMDLVLKNSGNVDDANDLFQDAMIVLYKNVRKDSFNLTSSLSSYLYGICRNLWLKKLRQRKRITNINDVHQDIVELDENTFEVLQRKEESDLLASFIQALGKDCQKVLKYFYYEKIRMEQIADLMEYANVQVAKNKKHLCLKKLRTAVLNDSRFKR